MSERDLSLPLDAVARCTKDAKRDGLFAGVTSGLLRLLLFMWEMIIRLLIDIVSIVAIIGSKFYRLNRNQLILCGVATGALAGYQFTQVFLATNLARLRAEMAQLGREVGSSEPGFGESSNAT
ncbi:hypothetical protein BC629DRAFT_1591102 [Irpex lacteus]|nr:hypothetical protein BC629DRAFT_1591102 [Irpex lacteus]